MNEDQGQGLKRVLRWGDPRRFSLCVWTTTARTLELVSQAYERTYLSRQALIVGLQKAPDSKLRRFSRGLSLPFLVDLPSQLCLGANAKLPHRLQRQALTSLLTPNWVEVPFARWLQTFRKLHAAHLRVQQLSAQSRAQVRFLTAFVPLISAFLCVGNWSRFTENLGHSMGAWLFVCGLVFYSFGVWLARWIVNLALLGKSCQGLERTSGKFEFLSEILSLSGGNLTRNEIISVVLCNFGDAQLRTLSKRQSLPFVVPLGLQCQSIDPSVSEFLASIQSGFVDATRCPIVWLTQSHAVIFDRLCAEASHGAAKLSVQLLIPMAIFFLPALFLILMLCGFSLAGDTLNSN